MYTLDAYDEKSKTALSLGLEPMTFKQAYTMRGKFTHYKHRSIRIKRILK